MTFDEYNTDENFDNDKSSLEELVKIGKSEGMSKDSIRSALSPKWQKSSKLDKFDEYYGKETPKKEATAPKTFDINNTALNMSKNNVTPKPSAPVSNPPATEQVLEKVITETDTPATEQKKSNLDKDTQNYMNTNSEIMNKAEDNEYEKQKKELFSRWDLRNENIDKMSQSMRRIDDHMVDQLPTFIFRRYQNGEFGDVSTPEGKKDAKLRLAHFMINSLGTALSNMSHTIRKDGQTEESDYEKYQNTNLSQGLENRWNKYKQETQGAIDVAKQGGMSEEAITDSIATISSNNRLQSAFNMMNERQKVFALNVLSELGDKMGNMNDEKFVNTLMGMSAMGDSLDYKEAAGMLVYRTVKDPEKRDKILNSLGLLGNGMSGAFNFGGADDASGGTETPATGATLEDGTTVDPGKYMNSKEYQDLVAAADNLSQRYYNGEIDEAKFRSEYAKLEKIMSEHKWFSFFRNKGIKSADDLIKYNNTQNLSMLDNEFTTLNQQAKAGEIKPSDYEKKFNSILERAKKWGANEKTLKYINDKKVKNEVMLKAAEKKNKKK